VPCRTADAAATVDALMRWFAVFAVVLLWISDRGSHFKNEVVQRVQKELKAKHHFATANCPWSNGTIESACKQVIRAFRAVLSELKMYADEWPEVVNMVQSVLNNSTSTRLNKRTPIQVFTGHAKTTPLALMLKDNVPVNAPQDYIKVQKLMEIEKLSKDMTEIHAQVAEKATRDRKAAIQKHNDKTHVRSPNFQVGDYVLVAKHRKSGVSKLQVKWKGPLRVSSVELAQAAEHNDHKLHVVSKILDARYNKQEMFHELMVAWRGFPVGEATCEPYSMMDVDVPDMVVKFMESHEDIDAVRKMRSL
jgi:hypothetical protein